VIVASALAEIGMKNNPLRDQFLTNFSCLADWLSCSMETVSVMRESHHGESPGTGAVATKKNHGEESKSALLARRGTIPPYSCNPAASSCKTITIRPDPRAAATWTLRPLRSGLARSRACPPKPSRILKVAHIQFAQGALANCARFRGLVGWSVRPVKSLQRADPLRVNTPKGGKL
jgi:hypothetical protein